MTSFQLCLALPICPVVVVFFCIGKLELLPENQNSELKDTKVVHRADRSQTINMHRFVTLRTKLANYILKA